jgi:hypothetical protein
VAAAIFPFIIIDNDEDKLDTRKTVGVFVASILVFCLCLTGIISLAEHLAGNGCADNETEITKQVGKSTVSKCVPDSTLGFLFN